MVMMTMVMMTMIDGDDDTRAKAKETRNFLCLEVLTSSAR